MYLSELLIPPGFFIFSTFIFLIAIQLPSWARILSSPFIFGTAIYSLHTSYYFGPHTGVNGLWALLNCVWVLHAASTLFFEQLKLPQGALPWTSAYKVWADPQRQINWNVFSAKDSFVTSSDRVFFAVRRLCKTIICCLLHVCVVEPFTLLYFGLEAQDFAPSRQVLFRRLLWPDAGPVIDSRELQIRLFVSVSWIWTGYLMLDTCHVLLSIFFVTILRIDNPEEWPPLFGSPLEAYSVRRFWVKFWHRMTVPSCTYTGKFFTRRIAKLAPGARAEKLFIAFWAFFLSAIYHAMADWQAGEPCCPTADFVFFMANFGAAAIETIAVPITSSLLKGRSNSRLCQILLSERGRKLIGYAWLLGFFFWIVPKWQYPKVYLVLRETEGSQYLKGLSPL
ncbi:uncharacterized protein N7479_009195 [Penicillium vulpinum]|uniref:Wax synthase domain-containing protein n=1 Tax=Penicillium vulpinum TaxID=29845 RepID=A0A1V6RVU8_9EURO|nr:uncharacterized protein N7479_009195 [Penicillium vulpinum]KAJ5950782.1 hypothetical protein N7479_009195 [Penicillium vulpinum]OQE05897.1 hypothetical protein PENVUL_c021G08701 [Penicillium vulpinum]